MKRLTVLMTVVLAACVLVCAGMLMTVNPILNEAHRLSTAAHTSMEAGDSDATREHLTALATLWEEKSALLEVLCDHDDLHNVKEHIITARICLERDPEDFFNAISLVGEGIEHIRTEEAPSWSNLL